MGVFGRFRRRTTHLPGGGSSWERTNIPADASLPVSVERRHLSQVPYLLPKDVLETQRLDFQFYLIRSILHGNHASSCMATMPHLCTAISPRSWMWAAARDAGSSRWRALFPERRWSGWTSSHLLSQYRCFRPMRALCRRTCSTGCRSPTAALISPTSGSSYWRFRLRTGLWWSANWGA